MSLLYENLDKILVNQSNNYVFTRSLNIWLSLYISRMMYGIIQSAPAVFRLALLVLSISIYNAERCPAYM